MSRPAAKPSLYWRPRGYTRPEPKRKRTPRPPAPATESAIERARAEGFRAGRNGIEHPKREYETSEEYVAWFQAWKAGKQIRLAPTLREERLLANLKASQLGQPCVTISVDEPLSADTEAAIGDLADAVLAAIDAHDRGECSPECLFCDETGSAL